MTEEKKKESNVVYLTNVRLSFPHLIQPYAQEGQGEPKYSADFILPATHAGWAKFLEVVKKMALEKWKEHASSVLQQVNGDPKRRCYGDGSQKVDQKTFKPYDGYAGMVFIAANRKQGIPPQIIQGDGVAIDPQNTMAYAVLTREMYGGCRVNAAIKPWLQENQFGRAVRCELLAIQKCGDDTPFGDAITDASGYFGQVAAPAPGPSPAGAPFAPPTAPMPAAPFGTPSALPSFLT